MSQKSKTTKSELSAKNNQGAEVHIRNEVRESPVLPVEDIERLYKVDPIFANFVMDQTRIEAEFRRAETKRVNNFIFIEKTLGQIFAFIMGTIGIGGSLYLGLNGQPVLAGTIATLSIGSLALGFIIKKQIPAKEDS